MKRRPGRPPLAPDDDPPARVHVTIPPTQYDRAHARAADEGISIPELVRRGLARALEDPPPQK